MLKNYLEYLKSICKKFAKENDFFDIVLYGSTVKGKIEIRDIDILLIFLSKPLKERAEIAQKFKGSLKEITADVKTINLNELFEKDFLARQGILAEGYSLIYDESFAKRLGFEGFSLFTYNLKGLNHNEKTKFTYALIGRKKEGILSQINAQVLGKGAVIIPMQNSLIFEGFLQRWKINYKKRNILASLL